MIERVQRRFARYLYKKMYGYYPFLFPSLFVYGMVGLDTLELRRKCSLMVHYYLLANNQIDNPSALSRLCLSAPDQYRRLRARRLLAAPPARTLTARYAPTPHAIHLLNALVAREPDVDIFFMCILKYDLYVDSTQSGLLSRYICKICRWLLTSADG
ncbi:hypothetical protein ABMA28_004820 [Loxostege sticticalis]|uniref:Uncharacterized protein n=1 Tax=Loxostege sticticalis TaxID=481309 RepID=A0ABD0SSM3_LOXSC